MTVRLRSAAAWGAVLALVLSQAVSGQQPQQQQQTPPKPFEPTVGMAGKDVVWVPTPPEVVEKMLDMAKVTAKDFVVDLGSGDGRNVIGAAKRGAKAVGFEYNPDMVELSRRLAKEAGVAEKATFVQGDMYEAEFQDATVLALFLLPSNLDKLKDKILALKPGTRVVMNTFTVDGWEADETDRVGGECTTWCQVLLHFVPAKVAGTWRGEGTELMMTQEFQRVAGTITVGGKQVPIENGRLRGEEFTFVAGGASYSGRVEGSKITGTAKGAAGGASRNWSVTRLGS
jgi:precorrin-6B methylase 2